jgi:hypothetical protein
MSLACHNRCTVAFDTPVAAAIERTLQRRLPAGGRVARLTISRWVAAGRVGLRPRPLASAKPAKPERRKRSSHSATTGRLTPTRRAVSVWLRPAARCKIISARRASRRLVGGRRTSAANALRCASVTAKARIGRATARHVAGLRRFAWYFARRSSSSLLKNQMLAARLPLPVIPAKAGIHCCQRVRYSGPPLRSGRNDQFRPFSEFFGRLLVPQHDHFAWPLAIAGGWSRLFGSFSARRRRHLPARVPVGG